MSRGSSSGDLVWRPRLLVLKPDRRSRRVRLGRRSRLDNAPQKSFRVYLESPSRWQLQQGPTRYCIGEAFGVYILVRVPSVSFGTLRKVFEMIGVRKLMVPKGGLEPPRVTSHAPQTCASASSATSAFWVSGINVRYASACRRFIQRATAWLSRSDKLKHIGQSRS